MSSWHILWSDGRHDRGGFQNADVGRTNFQKDFGPDYGVDYARFADDPDIGKDRQLQEDILTELNSLFQGIEHLQLKTRNGFVIVKGYLPDEQMKGAVFRTILAHDGVREIISNVEVSMENGRKEKDESKVEFGNGARDERIPSVNTPYPDQKGSPGGNEAVGMPSKNPRVNPQEDQSRHP